MSAGTETPPIRLPRDKAKRERLKALVEERRYRWPLCARPAQLWPDPDRDIWLILSGRGWGKTRTGAEQVRAWAESGHIPRIHLVAATAADARDTMVEGPSGLLSVCHPKRRPVYEPSKRRVTFPNGCQIILFSAEEPDRLRGPECGAWWGDELAAWKYLEEAWDNLQFGARMMGPDGRVRGVITSTPRPLKMLRALVADPNVCVTRGATYENQANLAPSFVAALKKKYEGTRKGKQEIHGQILDDNPNALWRRLWLDMNRTPAHQTPPRENFIRIVVGVDPQAAEGEEAAETGIVVVGENWDHQCYVLEDATVQGTPGEWGARVVKAWRDWNADKVVAESNNGGAMVKATIQQVHKLCPVDLVWASRGKQTRAEPVATFYEQGAEKGNSRAHHCGAFPALEDQMCEWEPGMPSPDRMDALVWAFTAILEGNEAVYGGDDYDPTQGVGEDLDAY